MVEEGQLTFARPEMPTQGARRIFRADSRRSCSTAANSMFLYQTDRTHPVACVLSIPLELV
jgi:hypothetical protein